MTKTTNAMGMYRFHHSIKFSFRVFQWYCFELSCSDFDSCDTSAARTSNTTTTDDRRCGYGLQTKVSWP